MIPLTLEKRPTYQRSRSIFQEILNQFNLQAKIYWHGAGKRQTAFCFLEREGKYLAKGAGKGFEKEQMELSACYEALETYLSSYQLFKQKIILASVKDIKKHYQPITFRFDDALLKNNNTSNEILPWVIVHQYDSKQPFVIPLATIDCQYIPLVEDTCNYYHYRCYASTNGLASAASYNEALIHAILEIIERDAISYFLLDTFLLKEPIKIIDPTTLPLYLQQLIQELEEQHQEKLLLVHFPSHFNVPVYGAIFGKRSGIIPRGFGASLNANYAAERAILEVLQTLHVYEYMPQEQPDLTLTKIKNYPVLLDCLRFDLMEIVNNNHYQLLAFTETGDNKDIVPQDEYLSLLLERIYQQNMTLYVNNILVSENGYACINAIIPGIEEFFHILNEQIILPQPRTKNYIQSKNK